MVHPRACRARNGRRFDETALLERRQRARGGERMAVEGELDERAPRDHPVGAEQLEHILLALLAATAARIAALDAAATMVAAAIVTKLDDPIEADGVRPRRTLGRATRLSNAGRTRTRPLTKGRSAAVAAGHRADRGRITRISHRDSRRLPRNTRQGQAGRQGETLAPSQAKPKEGRLGKGRKQPQ